MNEAQRPATRTLARRSIATALLTLFAVGSCIDPAANDTPASKTAVQQSRLDPQDIGVRSEALVEPPIVWPVVVVQLRTAPNDAFNFSPTGRTTGDLLFGPFPSIRDYYRTLSNNQLNVTPADQGVYTVVVSAALDAMAGVTPSTPWVQAQARRVTFSLEQQGFRFSNFDNNGDGEVTSRELGMVIIDGSDQNTGANRPTWDEGTYPNSCPVAQNNIRYCGDIAFVGHHSQFMNYVHELSHSLGMVDLYGFWNITCYGNEVTMASCTAGVRDDQVFLYYPDPYHRRGFGWMGPGAVQDINVSSQPSGSQRIRPVSRTMAVGAGGVHALYLNKGNESFILELRRRDGNYDDNVAVEGVLAWYLKTDGAGNLVRTRFTDAKATDPGYNFGPELAHYPVPPDGCHLDELYGRGIVEPLQANTAYRLRSEKLGWNLAVTVSPIAADGLVTVSWAPVADDNWCPTHNAHSSSFVGSQTSNDLSVVRAVGPNAGSADWTAAAGWDRHQLPPSSAGLGYIATVSRTPSTLDAFAIDGAGAVVQSTRNAAGTWSAWTPLTAVGTASPNARVAAVSRKLNHLDIFFATTQLGELETMFMDGGNVWGRATIRGNPGLHEFSLDPLAGPVAVSRSAYRILVYFLQLNGGVRVKEWRPSLGWFGEGTALENVKNYHGMTAVARNRELVELFVSSDDGTLWRSIGDMQGQWWAANTLNHQPHRITAAQMGLRPRSPLAAVSRTPSHVDVFGINLEGRIVSTFNTWGSTGWFPAFPLSGPSLLASGPSPLRTELGAIARSADHLDVFAADGSGGITSVWWDASSGWASEFALPMASDLVPVPGDFDSDLQFDDLGVWRPSTRMWSAKRRDGTAIFGDSQWGLPGDMPLVGDFDSDGSADDLGIWRPSNGLWFARRTDGSVIFADFQWGLSGDVPLVGDFDSDGQLDDMAVWRPSNGMWFARRKDGSVIFTDFQWGAPGDVPLVGDFDSDGQSDDMAVWRPSNGMWYARRSNGSVIFSALEWGVSGDVPLVGDFDSDGQLDDMAVWRPFEGNWFARRSDGSVIFSAIQWGLYGDVPFVGDFDSDGRRDDLAVWRPTTASWYAKRIDHTPIFVDLISR